MSTKLITFEITVERVRQLMTRSNTAPASSGDAESFLHLFGEQLETMLGVELRKFVEGKMVGKGAA